LATICAAATWAASGVSVDTVLATPGIELLLPGSPEDDGDDSSIPSQLISEEHLLSDPQDVLCNIIFLLLLLLLEDPWFFSSSVTAASDSNDGRRESRLSARRGILIGPFFGNVLLRFRNLWLKRYRLADSCLVGDGGMANALGSTFVVVVALLLSGCFNLDVSADARFEMVSLSLLATHPKNLAL